MAAELTPYANMADTLASLPMLLRAERRRRHLSQRAAAREIGCAFATLNRIEAGRHDCVVSHAVAILRWLDTTTGQTGQDGGTR